MNLTSYKCRLVLFIWLVISFLCLAADSGEKDNTKGIDTMKDMEKIQQLLKGDKPLIWLFTGDSITHGALHTYGWRSFPEHFSERIRWEMSRGLDYVINTGISGHRVTNLTEQFQRRIGMFQPDVVFVMIGTNDSAGGSAGLESYEANLSKLIDMIRQNNSIPVFNTPNPILTEIGGGTRASLPEYVEVMRKIAQQKGVILIDHWKHWETAKPNKDAMMEWLADSLHPNHYGHIEIAKEMFKALNIYDANSKTCGLFVP